MPNESLLPLSIKDFFRKSNLFLAQHATFVAVAIFFITNCLPCFAINRHSITGLKLIQSPVQARINDSVSLSASFMLKSSTGFDTGRLKAFVIPGGGANGVPLAGRFSIGEVVDNIAEVSFTDAAFRPITETTTLRFEYWLTRSNGIPPQAKRERTVTALPALNTGSGGDNTGGGSTDGNNGSSIGNGSVVVEHVLFLDIEEASDIDVGFVSNDAKTFRLIVTHNQDYISFVNKDLFNANLDPLLNNLVIRSRDSETGEKTGVTANFNFGIEQGSVADPDRDNFLITQYISGPIVIKEAQRLSFSADMFKFLEKAQVSLPDGLITQDSAKYRLKPLSIPLTNITINPTSLDFNQDLINARKGKQLLVLDDATITANLKTDVDFDTATLTSSSFNKSQIKLTSTPKQKIAIKPELENGALTINTIDTSNGDYSISLPIKASINTGKNTFVKTKLNFLSSTGKTIVIPIELNMDSNNGLDLFLEGELNQEVIIDFETLEEAGAL